MHDLWARVDFLRLAFNRGFDNRADLHLENLRVRHRQTTTAMPKHRIRFVQLRHAAFHLFERHAHFAREFALLLLIVRHKLVQRRIEQTHRHRQAIHRSEDPDEVSALKWQQLQERLLA